MRVLKGLGKRSAQLFVALMAVSFLTLIGSMAEAQHSSAECPAQTGTVSSGGTVTIDVTDCAVRIAFAGVGVIDGGSFGPADFEDHGKAVLRITGS